MIHGMAANKHTKSKRFAPLGIVFGVIGLLLFVYFVRKAGPVEILSGIRRLGFGLILILAISSIRHIVRSLAWIKCVEKPFQLRFRDAFAARLMGDALGNIIPLASVAVSEPSKAGFCKRSHSTHGGILSACDRKHLLQLVGCAFHLRRNQHSVTQFLAAESPTLREH
jgi:hypothetical protein